MNSRLNIRYHLPNKWPEGETRQDLEGYTENNYVPYNQVIVFNTCENKANRPDVTVAVSPGFVNAPWLSEFLR